MAHMAYIASCNNTTLGALLHVRSPRNPAVFHTALAPVLVSQSARPPRARQAPKGEELARRKGVVTVRERLRDISHNKRLVCSWPA